MPGTIQHFLDEVTAALQVGLDAIAPAAGTIDASALPLSAPPDPELGDAALACFSFLRQLDGFEQPAAAATALAAAIPTDGAIDRVTAAGPYVNLRYATRSLARSVVGEVLESGERFGSGAATGTRVVLEFSAPNTNKPQHLGHVRNNFLGEASARILAHAGDDVVRVNLVNDRGIHICKSMLAYQRFGEGVTPDSSGKKGDHLVGDFYVRFDREFTAEYVAWLETDAATARYESWLDSVDGRKAAAAARQWDELQTADEAGLNKKQRKLKKRGRPNPHRKWVGAYKDAYFNEESELGSAARSMLLAWEAGDAEVRALWSMMNGWVLEGFAQTYDRMGIRFDHTYFESETYKLGKDIVERGVAEGVFSRRDDGATTFDLGRVGLSGDKVVLRSDGTSVYVTQDLGTAITRREELGFDRMIYVVADEQNYHFKVLFGILEALDPSFENVCEHLAYGLVNLPHGRMKSREGTVVDADDLMDEVVGLIRAQMAERSAEEHYEGADTSELDQRAEALGQAALKYYLLDVNPKTTMRFDPEESIESTGRTGVYGMYNYARSRSVLRKAGGEPTFAPDALDALGTSHERQVLLTLLEFPALVRRAALHRDPSPIAEFIFNLGKPWAYMFTDKAGHSVLNAGEPALREARIQLVHAIGIALRVALGLLGIETIEEV